MESSKLYFRGITVAGNPTSILITTQRIQNDINGNPKHFIQVWTLGEEPNTIWKPTVQGYRHNTQGGYNVSTANIDETIEDFVKAFEFSVNDKVYYRQ